jgi:hypothetical protein
LCQLPAAQHFGSAEVLQLLQAAVQHSAEHAGASRGASDSAQQLFSSDGCVAHLCKLQAAEQLGGDELRRLVEVAEEQGCSKCVEELRHHELACRFRSDVQLTLYEEICDVFREIFGW